jgi:hypothetical protein
VNRKRGHVLWIGVEQHHKINQKITQKDRNLSRWPHQVTKKENKSCHNIVDVDYNKNCANTEQSTGLYMQYREVPPTLPGNCHCHHHDNHHHNQEAYTFIRKLT